MESRRRPPASDMGPPASRRVDVTRTARIGHRKVRSDCTRTVRAWPPLSTHARQLQAAGRVRPQDDLARHGRVPWVPPAWVTSALVSTTCPDPPSRSPF